MPFEHAEDLDAQQRGVALFQTMGLSEMAHWAQVHLDIIARFGRFPHRNAVLGRASTPAETGLPEGRRIRRAECRNPPCPGRSASRLLNSPHYCALQSRFRFGGFSHEDTGARGGDRRRRGRRRHALSSGQEGLERRRPDRAQGADLRLHLACRRPAAAVQPVLFGGPDPQVFGQALWRARGRDRPACGLQEGLQHPPRPHQGPLGRVHVLRRRGRDHRRQGQCADAAAGQGDLAAVRDRRPDRRHPASRRRLHPAGRPDPGHGQGCAQPRRRDLPQHHRHRASSRSPMASGW